MDIRDVRKIQQEGRRLGRAGLSQRVLDLIGEFDGSYKGAMILAGRMRVIAAAASQDEYWREQVDRGEARELRDITKALPVAETESD